ncbi:MAG: nucleotidyltransferase [Polyangiaceae bacterium]
MAPKSALAQALRAVSKALQSSGRSAMIIGGIAVIARGVPRLTKDIDATVAGGETDLHGLLEGLKKHGIVPRVPNAVEFARESQVLLLVHDPSGVDVDLSLAWLPFELEALEAAEDVSVHGTEVRIPRVDDLVIYKVVGWRPQDRQDIERLVSLHGKAMNLERVMRLTRELSEALEAPERLTEVEQLITRVLKSGSQNPGKAISAEDAGHGPERPQETMPAQSRTRHRKK